jgi:hypothetical protein
MLEGDYPELDVTEELQFDGIRLYQSLIGALQWAVTLGRFDILMGVVTMSSFRVAPRQGHLDRLKRMYGYLKRNPDGAIRFRIGIPNHEARDTPKTYDWMSTVYGNHKEELPDNMPEPKGKPFRTTTYADANLMHCLVTGRSMSGIIHLVNQTPIQWFCKKQNVVETATYGSEFMVARQATEQIMDLRYTLRMMGIPIDGPSWLFGDNQSVITSSNIPHSNLNKRHNALSYHRVREAIAAEILYFLHMDGKYNPSDILTKFLNWAKFWPLVQPLLFWKGETNKDNNNTLPITQMIEHIKSSSPSGLRGVTSCNYDTTNGNSVNPSEKMNTSGMKLSSGEQTKSPGKINTPGKIIISGDALVTGDALVIGNSLVAGDALMTGDALAELRNKRDALKYNAYPNTKTGYPNTKAVFAVSKTNEITKCTSTLPVLPVHDFFGTETHTESMRTLVKPKMQMH